MGDARGAIVGLYTALVNAPDRVDSRTRVRPAIVTGELMTQMVDILRHCLDEQMNHIDAVFPFGPTDAISRFVGCTGEIGAFPRLKKCSPMVTGEYNDCVNDSRHG